MPITHTANSKLSEQETIAKNQERNKAILENAKEGENVESKLVSDLEAVLRTGINFADAGTVPDRSSATRSTIKTKSGKSKTTYGLVQGFEEPGVKTGPMNTQSIDAATQAGVMLNSTGLNVHDAYYFGANNFEESVQKYNQIFLQVNSKYSIPREVYTMLERVVNTSKQYKFAMPTKQLASALVTFGAFDSLKDAYAAIKRNGAQRALEYTLSLSRDFAMNKVSNRNKVLKRIGSSEQYSMGEGSAFKPKKQDTLGSSSATLSEYEFNDGEEISAMNMEEVFDKLQDISIVKDGKQHLEHLRNVLRIVSAQVKTPLTLYMAESAGTETIGAIQGSDIRIVNQIKGDTELSGMLANGIRMSTSEVFVHELVHAVTRFGIEKFPAVRNQLEKLWEQAKGVMTYRDFMSNPNIKPTDPNYVDEVKAAKERYDHVFKPRSMGKDHKGRKRSQHLHEFVAMGMTNANFRKALSKLDHKYRVNKVTADNSFGRLVQGIQNWFQTVANLIQSWLQGTKGKTGDKQLDQLFETLIGLETSNKARLAKKADEIKGVFTSPAIKLVQKVKPGFDAHVGSVLPKFKEYAKDKLKTDERAKQAMNYAKDAMRLLEERHETLANIVSSTVTEARGRYKEVGVLHDMKRLGTQNIDRTRKAIQENLKKAINQEFNNELTPEQRGGR